MPTQKKKQSRFARLGAKLRTPKGRLAATVLVFAAIGGGIFVYKSFAATASWSYTVGNGLLVQTGAAGAGCGQRHVWDPQINSYAYQMNCNKGGGTVGAKTYGATLSGSPWLNSNYRFCAYVKGVGQFAISARDITGNGLMTTSSPAVNNTSNYSYVCTAWYRKTVSGWMEGRVNVSGNLGGGAFINVGAIVIERQ